VKYRKPPLIGHVPAKRTLDIVKEGVLDTRFKIYIQPKDLGFSKSLEETFWLNTATDHPTFIFDQKGQVQSLGLVFDLQEIPD